MLQRILFAGAMLCAVNAFAAPPPALVHSLLKQAPGLHAEALQSALTSFERAAQHGLIRNRSLLTVIDYSLPSTEPRLWVIDVPHNRILHRELVAHGEGSGDTWAVAFSNVNGSRQSSIGLFRTEDTYVGGSGYSLRLNGLEPGVNDHALSRNIVVHGAAYVEPETVAQYGRIGRSWGCPAVPREAARDVIEDIKGGSAVFAYYPDPQWLTWSHFLRCDGVGLAQR